MRRRIMAQLLLMVFVPMLMASVLHIHHAEALPTCDDCTHQVSHSGHIASTSAHSYTCLLCQFVSLPFVAAVVVRLVFYVVSPKATCQWLRAIVPVGVALSHPLRGPPCQKP